MADATRKLNHTTSELDAAVDMLLEVYTREEIDSLLAQKITAVPGSGLITDDEREKLTALEPYDDTEVKTEIELIKTNGSGTINGVKVVGKLDSDTDLKIAGKVVAGKEFTVNNTTVTAGTGAEIFNNTNNTATGMYSHAEGSSTVASGANSHAEGSHTKATNVQAHAEGRNTAASGPTSHAEGGDTTASGTDSHAEGRNTIAASDTQHVQGKYNVKDAAGKYAFIIGNGSDNTNRSNALAVDWQGKLYVNNAAVGVNVNELEAMTKSTLGYHRKNLLKNTAVSKTQSGVTFTVNGDGTVSVSGTAAAGVTLPIGQVGVERGRYYAVSGCPEGGSPLGYRLDVRYFKNNTLTLIGGALDIGEATVVKLPDDADDNRLVIYIRIGDGTDADGLTFRPMLRYAEISDDSYEPYKPSVEERLAVLEEKFAALGGAQGS